MGQSILLIALKIDNLEELMILVLAYLMVFILFFQYFYVYFLHWILHQILNDELMAFE